MKKIFSLLMAVTIFGVSIISIPVFAAPIVDIAQFVYSSEAAGDDLSTYMDKDGYYLATDGTLKMQL